MTRCPNTCDKSDPEGKAHGPCELKPGHDGLCVAFGQTFDAAPARDTSGDVGPADHLDGLVAYAAPAPHDAPLDFENALRDVLSARGVPLPEIEYLVTEGGLALARMSPEIRIKLQCQARAYADAAVKAERARIAVALIECEDIHGRGKAERGAGCDYCAGWLDAADFVTTSGEARDDPR